MQPTHTHMQTRFRHHAKQLRNLSPREQLNRSQRHDITLHLTYYTTDDKVRVLNYIALVISGLLRKISPSLTKVSRTGLICSIDIISSLLNITVAIAFTVTVTAHSMPHSPVFPYHLLAPKLGIHDPRTRPC
jgi:hypothetical protein